MDALSPSFGLVWKPVPGVSLYTNVATAFETPTTTEPASRSLRSRTPLSPSPTA